MTVDMCVCVLCFVEYFSAMVMVMVMVMVTAVVEVSCASL